MEAECIPSRIILVSHSCCYHRQLLNISLSYRHVITGAKSARMEDALGGILADDMGLGKTLSMLAVVVASLGSALNFAIKSTSGAPSSWQNLVPSKATLVVVPSARKFPQLF